MYLYKRIKAIAGRVKRAAARDDGAALVIVLTIIFVMTTLGGIALIATLTNLRMSAKYTSWTSEYYALDKAAETKLMQLDGRLSQAENYAYAYMHGEYYSVGTDAPAITGDGATDINDKAQEYIYSTWYNNVYQPCLSADSAGGPEILDEERYNRLFERFNSEFFQRLYYYFSYKLISRDLRDGVYESVELTPGMAGFAGMLDNYSASADGMKVKIGVSDGKEEFAKHVDVDVYVTAPVFGLETRTEDIPFKANPIWTGALTARGSIKFMRKGAAATVATATTVTTTATTTAAIADAAAAATAGAADVTPAATAADAAADATADVTTAAATIAAATADVTADVTAGAADVTPAAAGTAGITPAATGGAPVTSGGAPVTAVDAPAAADIAIATATGAIATGASAGTAARVYGDVSAIDFNEFYIDQNDWVSPEGNEYGIASDGAAVEIYGNVYTRGDLHVIGSGGSIAVSRYPDGFATSYREGIFGNTLFFDASTVPVMIQRFTQIDGGTWDRHFIPFFYRDSPGGNVYCNNLSIEEGVYGGSITIDNGPAVDGSHNGGAYNGGALNGSGMPGVVWTLDDVQNDGYGSRITIGGNLIGISSDATFDDHTSSSAVINTHYDSGSAIDLMGAVIAPGVAFMKFDGVNDMMDENTFFETAESISATNTEILKAYIEKPEYDPGALYYFDRYTLFTDRGASDFFLIHFEQMFDKVRHIANRLSGRIPETGIAVNDRLEGYTRGAVVASDAQGRKRIYGPPGIEGMEDYSEIVNYADNYLAYSEIKDSLIAAYKSKTESFGTAGYKFGDFVQTSSIFDQSGKLYSGLEGSITYFKGDGALDLDGDMSGIVYCASAMDGSLPKLTIRGDGSFRGTIISEGDIIIEGHPEIRYDESLISKILLYNPEIRCFFSPGEMGDTSYVRVMGVAQGVKKLVKDRYRVAGWTEWQE